MTLPSEPEFEQALNELTTSLGAFLDANPEYRKALEVVQIPERIIQFRVVWEDDRGQPQVNRGYRVQVCDRRWVSARVRFLLTRTFVHSTTLPLVRTRAVFVCILQ